MNLVDLTSRFRNLRLPPLSGRAKRVLRRGVISGLMAGYLGGMVGFGGFAIAAKDLPDPKQLWDNQRPVSVQIVDRQGRDILVRGATVAPRVKIEALPFHVPLTILAVEDKRFYNHIGIDPEALLRATVQNIKAGSYVQGGSTLTQQLSKNVFLSPEKTLRRKAQEMLMAIWLERSFTKDEILELYLSKVYFGSGAWGLEAASKRYFDKPAAQLNLSETAMLAGLLRAPSALNPVQHPSRAAKRTAVVLNLMEQQNLIGSDMLEQALNYPIRIHRPQSDNSAQYFVDWIWPQIESVLGDTPSQDLVVQTTLDRQAQTLAQNAVIKNLDPQKGAEQAALVTLDGTGAVLAMIGGASYSDSQFNRSTQAERQPGSAFKPFVYLAALEAGISPWDERIDEPITLTSRIDSWTPKNFSKEFKGVITVEEAFAQSINTVAVKLGEEAGRSSVMAVANRFGLEDLSPIRSLALGSHVTTPLKLTQSYLPFANFGRAAEPYGIISISTANGTPLYDAALPPLETVIATDKLAQMNRLMTRTVQYGTGRRAQIQGRDIGGKTGTTNDFRDAWFMGYAPDIVTGVWTGNDTNAPMKRITGGKIPAQIFQDYMSEYLKDTPVSKLIIAQKPQIQKEDRELDSLLDRIEEALP
ncbi:penicillin-binding protein 1A [Litorimonas taeanensis]|uniref:Penicillin-binding protein 1A n=1 Tax=Litorimonas taeanensis TaxID=568099 RepID=A0A420WFQ4_9PROT|nr:PBP1A family penicillin-binding protein [Litorimonas taeanensis]RKQ69792.1 penicillin-binding protein 1A [Litorimonas taeanensis]